MRIIAGKYKNRLLKAPKEGTRPTLGMMREAVFNICQQNIAQAKFLDVFAGSGAMGLEALSRGAAHTTFIENSRKALFLLEQNIGSLEAQNQTTLLRQDVRKALPILFNQGLVFDIIYIDPPYGKGHGKEVLAWLDEHCLLAPGGVLFLEEETEEKGPWKNLLLNKVRKLGRATLMQFSYLPAQDVS
jgi:16S rRNA (guanine966-N2)-methyltransferase